MQLIMINRLTALIYIHKIQIQSSFTVKKKQENNSVNVAKWMNYEIN